MKMKHVTDAKFNRNGEEKETSCPLFLKKERKKKK